jgi:uncharacterized protein YebE (UPF0316 family)
MDTFYYTYILLPILIFLARIMDVSIGTLRIILVSRGNKYIAPVLVFFRGSYLDSSNYRNNAKPK